MILPHANLLLYAFNSDAPDHDRAAQWWETCLNENEPVGLTWLVLLAVLRISTKPGPFDPPASTSIVLDDIDAWLTRPHVRMLEPKSTHVQAIRSIAEPLGLGGDVMNDVHLAALALEYGAVVHTADNDFARFTGVRWHNPLQEK